MKKPRRDAEVAFPTKAAGREQPQDVWIPQLLKQLDERQHNE
jgi:hypothetical protein